MEPAIIPDDDPLYDEDQAEDGEIYDDGSMPGTSYIHDDESGDMNFMVTEVDPPHMDSEEEDEDYEENGKFSVPSHIANGSGVSLDENVIVFNLSSNILIIITA